MPRIPWSLATRLSVLFAVASALILAGIGQYLYGALEKQLGTQQQEHLNGMLELVIYTMDQVPSHDALAREPQLVSHLLIGHAGSNESISRVREITRSAPRCGPITGR